MTNYVPLNKSVHREAGIRQVDFGFASQQAAVPLVMEDIPRVLALMVIGFVARAGNEGMELVALQSLEPGKNLYVHTNGRWITGYKPAWYRSHPFRLILDEKSGRHVLCVDEDADAFTKEAGPDDKRLFDTSGDPTELTHNLLEFLTQAEKSRKTTQDGVDELYQAGVIKPWQISVRNPHGESGRDIGGVYQIDEKALRQLDEPVLARMARSGALSIAYAQLFSQHRLPILAKLYDLRNEANRRQKGVDLKELFLDDDEGLDFNF